MSATTIYVIFNDHDNPMGCSCCRYEGPEYIMEMFFDEGNAKAWLEEKYKEYEAQDKEDEDQSEERKLRLVWNEDKTELSVSNEWHDKSGRPMYRYFIMPMEVN